MTAMPESPLLVRFVQGTLVVENCDYARLPLAVRMLVKFDERIQAGRARACDYAALMLALRAAELAVEDQAAEFAPLALTLHGSFQPRPHQATAFQRWREAGYRALVALPTGSSKTFLAVLAIHRLQRPTLVMVPTIDLVQQWASTLQRFFQIPIGLLGGGARQIESITVSTYDSAVLNMEFLGNQFAFLVFDECHHLPGAVNRTAAAMSLAPYRLGLTATPEVGAEQEAVLHDLIGPLACQIHIDELEGQVLAPYRTIPVELSLDAEEKEQYVAKRAIYTDFLKRHQISFRSPDDWRRFLGLCARLPDGKAVFDAFLEQRRIARSGRAKIRAVWELLQQHAGEQVIIFTADNATAYQLGREFFLPVLTHHTKLVERKAMLEAFRSGRWPVLVTSKVLNEGVDVPEANIAIILSGSGSIREHVQRLGRILRAAPGKEAILYELLNADTAEIYVSRRRREHRAYRH